MSMMDNTLAITVYRQVALSAPGLDICSTADNSSAASGPSGCREAGRMNLPKACSVRLPRSA